MTVNTEIKMTSSRPYIVKALHEWIVDNHLTPYLLVNAQGNYVRVPMDYVDNGKIVLNISPSAVNAFVLEHNYIEFEAKFRGVPEHIYVPMNSILAIYAKENGRGMAFEEEGDDDQPPPTTTTTNGSASSGGKKSGAKGHLKVVK